MILGKRNWAAGVTPTGGSWRTSRPASNATIMPFRRTAASSSAANTSSVMDLDLSTARPIGAASLTLTNIRAGAQINLRAAASNGALTSSPAVDVTFDAWRGSDTPASNTKQGGGYIHIPAHIMVLAEVETYQHWRVRVLDDGNPDGSISIGYLGLWEVWQPANGINYGNALDLVTGTVGDQSLGGVPSFDRRPNQRVFSFTTGFMDQADADAVLDIARERDLDQPILIVPNDTEPTTWLREAFVARLQRMPGWAMAYDGLNRRSAGWVAAEYEP